MKYPLNPRAMFREPIEVEQRFKKHLFIAPQLLYSRWVFQILFSWRMHGVTSCNLAMSIQLQRHFSHLTLSADDALRADDVIRVESFIVYARKVIGTKKLRTE